MLAHKTDTGLIRDHNEDSLGFIHPEEILQNGTDHWDYHYQPITSMAVVADGMGGHAAGEVASSITIDSVMESIEYWVQGWPTLNACSCNDPTSYRHRLLSIHGIQDPSEWLKDSLSKANTAVLKAATENPEARGMGTTCTAAIISRRNLHIGHIGDSRLYMFRDNNLIQITRDHTLVQDLVDRGTISLEEAWIHPQKNQITNAIGLDSDPEIETHTLPIHALDKILLCSDGLNSMLRDTDMERILRSNTDLDEACDSLITAANEAGGYDNTTVILMQCPDF